MDDMSGNLDALLTLEIRDDEPSSRAGHIQPCSYLATGFGIRVEIVSIDADSRDHHAKDEESPREGGDHVVIMILKGETQQYQSTEHPGRTKPYDRQPCLGF